MSLARDLKRKAQRELGKKRVETGTLDQLTNAIRLTVMAELEEKFHRAAENYADVAMMVFLLCGCKVMEESYGKMNKKDTRCKVFAELVLTKVKEMSGDDMVDVKNKLAEAGVEIKKVDNQIIIDFAEKEVKENGKLPNQ